MSLRLFAFCMGWLELGFVIYSAHWIEAAVFVLFAGVPCAVLMAVAVLGSRGLT